MKYKLFYRVYRFLGWTTILFAFLIFICRFATPYFTPRVPQLSEWVAKQLAYPTLIQEIKLSWEGLSPAVSLHNVEILTQDKKSTALHINKMILRLNVPQLIMRRLQLDELVIDGAVGGINVSRKDKTISVAKLPQLKFNFEESQSDASFINRLLIQNSSIDVAIDNETPLSVSQLNLMIEQGTTLKVRANGDIAGEKVAKVEVMADVPLWGHRNNKIYLRWQGGSLNLLGHYLAPQPFTLSHQDADVEVWLDFKDKQHFSLSALLNIQNAFLEKDKVSTLALGDIAGPLHISVKDDKWDVSTDGLRLSQNEEVNFVLSQQTQANEQKWFFKCQHLNLAKWQERLSFLALFPQKWAHLQQANAVQGQLDFASIALSTNQDGIHINKADVVITDLGLKSTSYPSFANASFAMTLHDDKGKMLIQSQALSLASQQYFDKPLALTELALVIDWQKIDQDHIFFVDTFKANIFDTPLQLEAKLSLLKDKSLPEVDLMFHVDKMSSNEALALLPAHKMDKDLISWLHSALIGGEHLATTAVLRGNLADFPFDQGEGIFEVVTELDHIHFNYKEGWPALQDFKADLQFRNRALFISALRGNLLNGQLVDADAVIPDLFAKMPELIVDTKIASTLSEGLAVVKQSPLPKALVKTLAPLHFEGPMNLSLGLEIPLSTKTEAPLKVRGLIEVNKATVGFEDNPNSITELVGTVSFTQDSVKADNLTGKLLSAPAKFSIDSSLNNDHQELTIAAQGNIQVDDLPQLLNIPEIPHLKGETDYNLSVKISPENDNQGLITISSSLKGIDIQAPAPLAKSIEDTKQLELKIYLEPNQLLHVAGKYGDNVSLAYSLGLHDKVWHSRGGHIHFGENRVAKFREDQILLIDGNLSSVVFSEWKMFLASTGLFADTNTNTTSNLALEPLVELEIGAFNLFGAQFENEKIEARWDSVSNQWNLLFDGAMLKGQIVIPKDDAIAVNVDLQKLMLTSTIADSNFNLEKTPSKHAIDIKIKEFILGNKAFSDIKARVEPAWNGYLFPSIFARMKETDITLSGNWDYLSPENKVTTEGRITTRNMSQTLNGIGSKGTVQKAKGRIDFALNWNGTPFKIDYPSLSGIVDFSLKEGTIQGMNPGIGRVLSLLNLDNVKRRLNLDFSDVTKSGFAFNELSGKFQFGKGKISSNNVMLNGPSAKIEAFGQADLSNQGLDGEMIVMPNVTGSLPVAAAIAAGNPAVGAAVWVVDKMFGNKIQQIHRVRYKVLGTWASPKVDELPMPLRGQA